MSEIKALASVGGGLFLLWLRFMGWQISDAAHSWFCPCGNT